MKEYLLDTKWKIWYHSINDDSWKNSSYKMIYDINNLYDLRIITDNIKSNHLQNGMFFVMKEDIFPTWEYVDNREGCCISFKVPASHLLDNWNSLFIKIITNEIFKDKSKIDELNGFSISPKKEFNIIKLWLKNNTKNYEEFINEYEPFFVKSKSIHKKHF
uniref:Uncharacterized protein n=1 Tax=viral metagenome TaxID=1070528 RepID=A0A6C0BVC0_9ZZZZ